MTAGWNSCEYWQKQLSVMTAGTETVVSETVVSEVFCPKFWNDKMFLCNNSDQTYFSYTLTSAGPLVRCWNPPLSTSLRSQQMLMHRKLCLIPIFLQIKPGNKTQERTNGSLYLLSDMFMLDSNIRATTWQNQQNECAPSEDSDLPGHPPSLIRVFAVRSVGS